MTVTITDKEIEKAVIAYAEEYLGKLSAAPDTHVFSERYEKRRAQIVAFGASPMRQARHRILHSVAAVITVLFMSFCMILAVSPTVRAAILSWTKDAYNKIVYYNFSHTEDDHAYVICAPGSIPEGFVRTKNDRTDVHTQYLYENAGTGEYLQFEYSRATEALKAEVDRQREGADLLVSSGSADKYCLESKNAVRVFWYDAQRQLVFFVDSNMSREALAECLDIISVRLPLYEPARLPEGYAETERKDQYPWMSFVWQNDQKAQLTLDYQDMSQADGVYVWSRGDDVVSETVEVAGCTGTYYPASEHEKGSGIVWVDEKLNMIFIINADDMDKAELVAFADSIRCTESVW